MNKAKLEEKMKAKHISKNEMCKILGISRSAFYRKCNGWSEFTVKEMHSVLNALGEKSPVGIFFD